MPWSLFKKLRRSNGAATAERTGFVDSATGAMLNVNPAKSDSGTIEVPQLPERLAEVVVHNGGAIDSFSRAGKALGLLTEQEASRIDSGSISSGMPASAYALHIGVVDKTDHDDTNKSRALRVSVDQRHRGTAPFATWLSDLKRADIPVEIESVSAQDFAEIQRSRQTSNGGNENAGLRVLQSARALFENLAAMGASDLHIMQKIDHTEVQVRIQGQLRAIPSLNMRVEEGEQLIRSICTGLTTSKEPTFNQRQFQNAQINGYETFPGTGLSSVRIIRGPSYPVSAGGQFLVARLQYGTPVDRPVGKPLAVTKPAAPDGCSKLREFGFTERQISLLDELMRMPHGVCLITGPTGSGKTTLLHELLKQQARYYPEARQVTVEDPVEYPMPWAIQIEAAGDIWQEVVQKFLRMDPDIGLLGELRAATEAVSAIQFAMTGHFVWTTLHTNDPYEVFTRLEDMDLEKLALRRTCDSGKIVGSVAVRLVKILCPHCKKAFSECTSEEIPAYVSDALKTWAPDGDLSAVRLAGEGCAKCDGGHVGRRSVGEVIITNPAFMEWMKNKGTEETRRWHRKQAGSDKSMLENAMELVLAGVVSPMDVQRNVHRIISRGEL